MSDFAFLRSGRDALRGADDDALPDDFLRKVASILEVLLRSTLESAARFAACCGRAVVTPTDMMLALKYEAHEFFERESLDADFFAALNRDEASDDDDSDDASDDDVDASGGDGGDGGKGGDGDDDGNGDDAADHARYGASDADRGGGDRRRPLAPLEFVEGDASFHARVRAYHEQWAAWEPDDPVKRLLKGAIDTTSARFFLDAAQTD